MNNEQFRKLMLANSAKSAKNESNGTSGNSSNSGGGVSALGSKQKSSIPMTPRSVAGVGRNEFAKQLAERNQSVPKPQKSRTSAPKGSRLAEGYVDRAKERPTTDDDDRETRLKALEESLKKEEIDQTTYERLRFQIAGGDLTSTHLVKGLDFKLLERIRKGEDVYTEKDTSEAVPEEEVELEDADNALEELEEKEVQAIVKEKNQKKGQYSTTLVPGQKRTRDQILAEMKAAREAAKAKTESALGGRFKKIGEKKTAGSRIERDHKGREVLIIVDEDGHEKRKVRKIAAEDAKEREAFVPDRNAEVLGMEVPEFYKQKLQEAEEEGAKEVDIFDDVDEYDPLAGLDSGSDFSDSEGEEEPGEVKEPQSRSGDSVAMPPPPKPMAPAAPRNYFGDSKTASDLEDSRQPPSFADPAVLAALRKAKTLGAAVKSEEEQKEADRQERLKKLIQSSNRDDADMDMGFGTNRMEDEEDGDDGEKIKLSTWGKDEGDEGKSGGEKSKRKRGGKKRKGDGNNAADVLAVMERRKAQKP